MIHHLFPRILLVAAAMAQPAFAQSAGVTILRGQSGGLPQAPQSSFTPHRARPPIANRPAVSDHSRTGAWLGSFPLQSARVATSRPLTATQSSTFAGALKAIDDHRYDDARDIVAKSGNPLLGRYVEWSILQIANIADVDFTSRWRFLRENRDWPELEALRSRSEGPITSETPDAAIGAHLLDMPALSGTGLIRSVAGATDPSPGDVPQAAGPDSRTDNSRASADIDRRAASGRGRPIPSAGRAIAVRAANAVTVIKGAAATRLTEENISSRHVRWFRQPRALNETKVAQSVPLSARSGAGGQAEPRWSGRQQSARELLAAGRAADAYAIIESQGQGEGTLPAEAEFLGGWIALRQLGRADEGLKHFLKLHDGARNDISRSRAAYWSGRAFEAAGRVPDANAWYLRAAGFRQTFYGQLAAGKLPGTLAARPGDPFANSIEHQGLAGHELVDVVNYLVQIGELKRTRPFLLKLARMVRGPGETALLAHLAVELKQSDIAATITRSVAGEFPFLDGPLPLVDIGGTGAVERALALALVKQESGFNVGAVSASGALGLMQILPGTAREVAAQLGLPFVQDSLTRNPAYNVALGTRYLAEMLQRFSGSYELALAAYNSGPNRVALWLASNGDPRAGEIDMVDWIEMIPFDETRNYVQRVMEGVGVYRERLNRQARTLPDPPSPS